MKAGQARVLLTGATGGIGQQVAKVLLKAGASLLLTGRSPSRLVTLVRQLTLEAGLPAWRVEWQTVDLNDAGAISGLAETATVWGCNVVIHNAGQPSFGRLESLQPSDMFNLLQTNLLAPMLLTQALLPHLSRQPKAQVICVGSVLGRLGLPGYSVYSASKFGLRGFAEAMRRELAGSKVHMQYLGPRATDTGFNNSSVQAYNQATGTAVDSPAQVAEALLQMLQDESAERFLGFPEKLAVRLNGLAPTWLDGSFKKHRLSLPELHEAPTHLDPLSN